MITKAERERIGNQNSCFSEMDVKLAALHHAHGVNGRERRGQAETFINTVYQISDGVMIVCPLCGEDDLKPCANDCGTYLCLGCDEDAGNIVHEAEEFDDRVFCITCADVCTYCEDEKGMPTGGGFRAGASANEEASGEAWIPCRQCEGHPGVVLRARL